MRLSVKKAMADSVSRWLQKYLDTTNILQYPEEEFARFDFLVCGPYRREIRYSEHGVAKAVSIQRKRLKGRKALFVHDWKKAYGKWPTTTSRSSIAETANESCALCASLAFTGKLVLCLSPETK